MEQILHELKRVKDSSSALKVLNEKTKIDLLLTLAGLVRQEKDKIIAENAKDLALLATDDPKYDRLRLTEQQILAMADDIELVATLADPCGQVLEERLRPNGLRIQKISVPLGVVAVIFESRPNVTIDVFTLCFKAGNACVLKGGKEAVHSNQVLVSLIQNALKHHGINEHVLYSLPVDRKATECLLNAVDYIDVCIPRGSQNLINFVREHAKIPVIETGAGIVHTYFDRSGDVANGRLIINNAKTRRVSVCNALDTLIIDRAALEYLPVLVELLQESNVCLYADEPSYDVLHSHYPQQLLHKAKQSDYGIEYLDYKMSIKTVDSVEEAVAHIRHYTSGHSEAIIAEDKQVIDYFLNQVDAAAVYVNASTAFTDGGQFGMGAEIGISTQKLHARGPMGLDALTSYQWVIYGDGQIRT